MKKFLALALVLIMILAVITACAPVKKAGPEVLQDPKVRQALSLAIDRVYICQQVWNNSRTPAYALVSGGIKDATGDKEFRSVGGDLITSDYQAAIKQAQKLLSDAGFPGGKGFPKLEYSYNSNSADHKAVAELLQNEWKQNLGIEVTLNGMDWNAFQSYRKTNDCQIARQGWLGDYADPSTFFDLFLSTAGTNDGHYNNANYDKLVKDAKVLASDPAKRMDLYHQAEKIIIDDMGMAPIAFYSDEVLAQNDFTGYGVTAMGNKMFWNTSKDTTTVCVGPQPETLDPNMNQSVDGMIYVTHLYEGLYRPKTDGTFELGQAKDVKKEAESDGSVKYTVTLRDDIFWSDGKPVTADDFVFSWQRLMDPATASPYAYIGDGFLKNGGAVMNGEAKPEELTVKAVNDKTLEFELAADIPFAQELLAFPSFMPLRRDIVTAHPTDWSTKVETTVTNGRYALKTIANEDKLEVVKSDKYWDKDSTKTTAITFKLINDTNAMLSAFKNKELDLIDDFPTDERTNLQKTGEYHQYPQVGNYYIQFNNIAVAKSAASPAASK